jgi:hypothetical protein
LREAWQGRAACRRDNIVVTMSGTQAANGAGQVVASGFCVELDVTQYAQGFEDALERRVVQAGAVAEVGNPPTARRTLIERLEHAETAHEAAHHLVPASNSTRTDGSHVILLPCTECTKDGSRLLSRQPEP